MRLLRNEQFKRLTLSITASLHANNKDRKQKNLLFLLKVHN